jgi:acyl-CoA synthetase (NDP forming)
MNLELLFRPRNVAIIGASRMPGKVGHEIVTNLIEGGFGREIIPVNPLADELLGLRCYTDVLNYDGTIDLSVVVLPASKVLEGADHSISKGAQTIIVITAGFKEVDAEGAQLEKKILDLCRSKQVRLLGPNCLGLINTHFNLNASFAQQMPDRGPVSVISQFMKEFARSASRCPRP